MGVRKLRQRPGAFAHPSNTKQKKAAFGRFGQTLVLRVSNHKAILPCKMATWYSYILESLGMTRCEHEKRLTLLVKSQIASESQPDSFRRARGGGVGVRT